VSKKLSPAVDDLPQQDFLRAAKAALDCKTWEDFCERFPVKMRALKTYLRHDDSDDHRKLPPALRQLIAIELDKL